MTPSLRWKRISLEVSPKWKRNSLNSENPINHRSMNWAQFKESFKCVLLVLTREAAGLNPFTVLTNIFVTDFAEFREDI